MECRSLRFPLVRLQDRVPRPLSKVIGFLLKVRKPLTSNAVLIPDFDIDQKKHPSAP